MRSSSHLGGKITWANITPLITYADSDAPFAAARIDDPDQRQLNVARAVVGSPQQIQWRTDKVPGRTLNASHGSSHVQLRLRMTFTIINVTMPDGPLVSA